MGLLSNQISRDKLKPGDHIYSWRKAYAYSHHGIYVSDEKVIHFTRGVGDVGLKTGTGTLLEKLIYSSIPKQNIPCPNCGDQSKLQGVISSCLDCFLAGGSLYLFEYSVSPAFFLAKQRGGTCTTATSDPCDQVIDRAEFLLSCNGFGAYILLANNCEDFATYCKTGLVVMSKINQGTSGQDISGPASSGQANSASAATEVISSLIRILNAVKTNSGAASFVASKLGYAVPGVGGVVLNVLVGTYGYGKYCSDCLYSDIGMRSEVMKVPVETLVYVIENLEGRLEQDKKST